MISAQKRMRRLRAWRRSQLDCFDEGCGECRVCRRLEFIEYVRMVAPRDIPSSYGTDDVDNYIRKKYPNAI